ncbi:MAG: VTT domain-containing protein [Candidatus Pristimantibacillus lignocellulolyticus]|uniref:TVP38/TMEM64 family membrane protein n=1 Tax=Candidatus Pristimantibacillus lignocellulolyticus TaxID=2994561 RepID=A0A9J6ZC63_9BACL|nr:MAG: VTT domain-containing protein [Candidatus Pristimantibacillus lignocellulolyticus]
MKLYKWITVFANVSVLVILFMNSETLLEWIKATDNRNLIIVLLVITILASIPGVPFGIVSGVIGAKYGVTIGVSLSVIASTLSSVFIYIMFRYLLLQQGNILLNKSKTIHRIDHVIKQRIFATIFIARIIPIMPAILINIYSGVFGLSFKLFLIATLLGKIPIMIVYTLIGVNLLSGSKEWIIIAAIYIVFLLSIYSLYRFFYNKKSI